MGEVGFERPWKRNVFRSRGERLGERTLSVPDLRKGGGRLRFLPQCRRELEDRSLSFLLRQARAVKHERRLVAAIGLYVCPHDVPLRDVLIARAFIEVALGSVGERRRWLSRTSEHLPDAPKRHVRGFAVRPEEMRVAREPILRRRGNRFPGPLPRKVGRTKRGEVAAPPPAGLGRSSGRLCGLGLRAARGRSSLTAAACDRRHAHQERSYKTARHVSLGSSTSVRCQEVPGGQMAEPER